MLSVYTFLRLPSFFEPVWHNDEGLYSAIAGQLMQGELLYRDAWDHKPPAIYLIYLLILTISGSEFYFVIKFINYILGITAIALVGYLSFLFLPAKKFNRRLAIVASSGITAFVLGVMWFEAGILNAENIFVPLVLLGLVFIFSDRNTEQLKYSKMILAGLCFGIAFLVKFHPLLDFLALLLFLFIDWMRSRWREYGISHAAISFGLKFYPMLLAFALPMLASLIYFRFEDALDIYFFSIFTFNLGYSSQIFAEIWTFNFYSQIAPWTKALVLTVIVSIVSLSFWLKKIPRILFFILLLFSFETFGALLANRMYFHYFLQMTPGFALLLAYFISHRAIRLKLKFSFVILIIVFASFILSLNIKISGEKTLLAEYVSSYYTTAYRYLAGDASREEWIDRFFIEQEANEELFGILGKYEGEKVYIHSRYSWVYAKYDLDNPSRYFVVAHIRANGAETYLVETIGAEEPKVIATDNSYGIPIGLRAKIAENYFLVEKAGSDKFMIWERKN